MYMQSWTYSTPRRVDEGGTAQLDEMSLVRCRSVPFVDGWRRARLFLRVMHKRKTLSCACSHLHLYYRRRNAYGWGVPKLSDHDLSFSSPPSDAAACLFDHPHLFAGSLLSGIQSSFLCFRSSWSTCIANAGLKKKRCIIKSPEGGTFI